MAREVEKMRGISRAKCMSARRTCNGLDCDHNLAQGLSTSCSTSSELNLIDYSSRYGTTAVSSNKLIPSRALLRRAFRLSQPPHDLQYQTQQVLQSCCRFLCHSQRAKFRRHRHAWFPFPRARLRRPFLPRPFRLQLRSATAHLHRTPTSSSRSRAREGRIGGEKPESQAARGGGEAGGIEQEFDQ